MAEDFLMQSNWDRVIRLVLQHEGGYVDHPKDPGGATNFGITIAVLRAYRRRSVTKADVQSMTVAEAKDIYKAQYWDPIKGDELPVGLDYAVFDFCVNSGPDRAVRDLQKVLGTVNVDGSMGYKTIAACEAYELGIQKLIRDYCDHRLAFMKSLKTWSTFGTGWSRRVNEVKAAAARMASKTQIAVADVEVINPGQIDKANPTEKKLTSSGRFLAAVTGGGGTAVAAADSAVGLLSPDKVQKVGDQAATVADKLEPYSGLRIVGYIVAALGVVGVAVTIYMAYNSVRRGQD
jgi:lysozyme family protein